MAPIFKGSPVRAVLPRHKRGTLYVRLGRPPGTPASVVPLAANSGACQKTYLHSSLAYEDNNSRMKPPKLTRLELQIMEVLWTRGPCAIREIQEAFPKRNRPAYSTIQTTVYRLEGKKTLRRVKKISHAHIFEASISRGDAQGRLIDELLSLLGDRLQPVMAHLIESKRLTLQDVREAEKALLALQEQDAKEEKP